MVSTLLMLIYLLPKSLIYFDFWLKKIQHWQQYSNNIYQNIKTKKYHAKVIQQQKTEILFGTKFGVNHFLKEMNQGL